MNNVIEETFDKLINNEYFNITVIELIRMVYNSKDVDEMEGNMKFYAQIIECVHNNDLKSVSIEEKEQFLIFHKSLMDIYNELNHKN